MRKFEGIGLTAVLAAAAASLAACGQPHDPARICVDGQGRRIADGACPPSGGGGGWGGGAAGGSHWYYLNSNQLDEEGAPAIGEEARGGSYSPDAGVAYGAAPEGGIARGGFGGFGGGGEGGEGGHGGGGE